jgi:UDP-N-acetylglucosamine 1-carboxyvinyltransferase
MNTFKIAVKGGKPLIGPIHIVSNKNAVLPAIAASILTKETMVYNNMPCSPDVKKMLQALEIMGARVTTQWPRIMINCEHLENIPVPDCIEGMQAGYLFVGPLLRRFKTATVPISSGCNLGYRGPEDHIYYFSEIGVTSSINEERTAITFTPSEPFEEDRLNVNRSDFEERSITYVSANVTPTENILMFLCGASRYRTELNGIAQEPHVVQHINLMRSMGAKIIGKGSTLIVEGVIQELHGTEFTPDPDHVHYFGEVIETAMTKSDRQINVRMTHGIKHMNTFIKKMGVKFDLNDEGVFVYGSQSSYSPDETFPREESESGFITYRMNTGPWSRFPVDCVASFIAWSTMNGTPGTRTVIYNDMYTDGLKYVRCMQEMGANITIGKNEVITHYIKGGNPYLNPGKKTIVVPNIIEGCRAINSCALSGGYHILENADYVNRRNPTYIEDLQASGADIQILN